MLVMCKTNSVMRYCVANHFLCSCVYDRICMDSGVTRGLIQGGKAKGGPLVNVGGH